MKRSMICWTLKGKGIQRLGDESSSFKVEVSYIEIYNEKVHDLLDPKG